MKGSANRAKARRALAREYEKVANKRADFVHKFYTSVVKENSSCVRTVVIAIKSVRSLIVYGLPLLVLGASKAFM